MSGRVRPGCEGRGLALGPKSHAYAQLLKEHPALKKCVGDKLYLPRIAAKMHETKVNYHWVGDDTTTFTLSPYSNCELKSASQ